MTGQFMSVSRLHCMVRGPLHMLERPLSGCRPSLLEPAILTLKLAITIISSTTSCLELDIVFYSAKIIHTNQIYFCYVAPTR